MKKKNIAVIITLAAALISCVISIITKSSFSRFVLYLGLSVLIFGIIGIVIQVVVEMNFKVDDTVDEEALDSEKSDDSDQQVDEINIENAENTISEDE